MDAAFSVAVRMIQGSGTLWGMGSDGTTAAAYHPLHPIRAYTAGKVCPDIVDYAPDEVIAREAALIAHTWSNAYILFMEDDPGTLAGGSPIRWCRTGTV